MKKPIKTLALVTATIGLATVVKRVRKQKKLLKLISEHHDIKIESL